MKKKFVSFFVYIPIIISLNVQPEAVFGQTLADVEGVIRDKISGQPLPGANIRMPELNKGVSSDQDGFFTINDVGYGKYTLQVRYVGFESIDSLIVVQSDTFLEIEMNPLEQKLDEVLVKAGRDSLGESTKSLTILDKAALDKHRGQTIGDMVKSLPGVTVLSTGPSISKPVVRGLHSQRLVLMNHGLAQEGQQWGGEHAPEIDPFSPDRIEIIRGASGVEYGVGAIGGVIRVDSDNINKKEDLSGELMLNGFSNNAQGSGSIKLEGGLDKSGKLGWRSQVSYRNAADSRTPKDVMRNTGFRELSYSFNMNYEDGSFEHDLYFSHFGTELGIFRGAHIGNVSDLERAIRLGRPTVDFEFGREIDNPRQEISHDLFRYQGKYQISNVGRIEVQAGWQQNRRKEFDAHRRFSNDPEALQRPAFDLELTTWSADLKFRHDPVFNSLTGTVGISGMKQGNARQSTGSLIPNFKSYSAGVFVIENWSNGIVTAETGARFDIHWRDVFLVENREVQRRSFTYNDASLVGGITYQFAPDWSVSGNFGTAWRPPGVNEQFSDGIHHGTAQFELGNEDLDPERSINIDLTLRHVTGKAYFQLSAYNNFITNYIFLQPGDEPALTIRGSFPFFSYEQTDAVIRGVDGTFEYQLLKNLRTSATVSFLRGWNRDESIPLIFMPSDRLQLFAHLDLPNTGLFRSNYLEARGTMAREQTHFPKGVDFAPPPPGYQLLDLESGTEMEISGKKVNLSLSLNNVLNATYRDYLSRFRYFIDEPGRSLVMRAQLQF